jgi:hypothetical protein
MLRKSVVLVFFRPGMKARQQEELQLKRVNLGKKRLIDFSVNN